MTQFFTPTETDQAEITVPYYEDARADYAPYYEAGRRKTTAQAQTEVLTELAKLGAGSIRFIEGTYGDSSRCGYRIEFYYGSCPGRIDVAGLPFKHAVTAVKKRKVLVQALLITRDWAKAAVTARVFSPGSDPLIPYLLVDGQRTLAEIVTQSGELPSSSPLTLALTAGDEFVEGEWKEN